MIYKYIILISIVISGIIFPQNYSDQFYSQNIDSIFYNIESSEGIVLSPDSSCILLQDSVNNGHVILKPQFSQQPFNQGLPSWNGTAPDNYSGFKIQMRFPYSTGWSPWLTVGYWKANIWSSYGSTSYGGGYIDYDTAKLLAYQSSWQFKIIMTRTSIEQPSPTLHKLSFFVSDTRTTNSINYTQILNDNPPEIFIPTGFVYQYGVDPQIGPSICSPSTVSMILRSLNIQVDPYEFSLATYDPYFNMFGIWPRVVQNASEYGVDGAVTRYRNWSDAYSVLADGGRIGMSIGQPLYSGHLVMLAGFTSDGRPIVHDPARSNGYFYIYNKSDISHSWFDKGGVAYTFYSLDSIALSVKDLDFPETKPTEFQLYQNYPNPFNPSTSIQFSIIYKHFVSLKVYDVLGSEVAVLVNEEMNPGNYIVDFIGLNLTSGVYLYKLQAGNYSETKKMILMK
jgi:hypothetical protein